MTAPTVNRYSFYSIFSFDLNTKYLIPIMNVSINGVTFGQNIPIPRGPVFGGLDLYSLMGRDIAGIWNPTELVIVGFY